MQNQPRFEYSAYYSAITFPEDRAPFFGPDIIRPSNTPISYVHFHNCLEVGYCCQGEGVVCIEDSLLPFSTGDISIIFSNVIHIHQSTTDDLSLWKFAYLDHEKLLSDIGIQDYKNICYPYEKNISSINVIHHNEYPELTGLVAEIITEIEKCDVNYETVVKALLLALLSRLPRVASVQSSQIRSPMLQDLLRIEPALRYISKNYMEQIKIIHLANICNISITHFRRLFKSAVNISPHEYLYLIRIKMASVLLHTSELSIQEISEQVGYTTLSSFNRYFKSIMGVSPMIWRKTKV